MSSPRHDLSRAKAAAPAPIDLNPRRDPALDFPDREFGTMSAEDYAEIGFMCGLEVHQQLATERKLFCRCPSGRRAYRVDAEVLRHMRPTLSEMGEYDGTALMEFKTRKEIVYLLDRRVVCTYELDDTPPFPINLDAVRSSLLLSSLFGLNLVSELHVMRKQYLDGSIPTGFQRTAMIGVGGSIPFRESELGSDREIRIRQLSLEEDSCREVSDIGHRIVFRTDRLGVPLVETVTEPDFLTPGDVARGGRLMSRVARATGVVLRGAGAARQDVNVSIAGSRRVEIKGVDKHIILPRLVHNEAFRHLNLLRVRAELERRGIDAGRFHVPTEVRAWEVEGLAIDARSTLHGAAWGPLRQALDRGDMVGAVRLPGFSGLLSHPSQPGLTFAHEIAERVRVIACLTAQPFMTHSDEPHIAEADWRELRAALQGTADDAVLLFWGLPSDVDTAIRECVDRAREAFVGVPSETRQARPDATTGFERILPGPQRMYPDTDTPPLPVRDEWIHELVVPELPWARHDRYTADGLDAPTAARLVAAPWNDLFDDLAATTVESRRRLAAALEKRLVHHWRVTGARELPDADRLRPLIVALESGRLAAAAFEACFDAVLGEPQTPSDEIVARHHPGDEDVAPLVAAVVAERDQAGCPDPAATLRWAMGRVLSGRPRGSLDITAVRNALIEALNLTEGER